MVGMADQTVEGLSAAGIEPPVAVDQPLPQHALPDGRRIEAVQHPQPVLDIEPVDPVVFEQRAVSHDIEQPLDPGALAARMVQPFGGQCPEFGSGGCIHPCGDLPGAFRQ